MIWMRFVVYIFDTETMLGTLGNHLVLFRYERLSQDTLNSHAICVGTIILSIGTIMIDVEIRSCMIVHKTHMIVH